MQRTEIIAEYNRIAAPLLDAALVVGSADYIALRRETAGKLIAFLGQFDRGAPLFFHNHSFPHRSDSIGERIDWLRAQVA